MPQHHAEHGHNWEVAAAIFRGFFNSTSLAPATELRRLHAWENPHRYLFLISQE